MTPPVEEGRLPMGIPMFGDEVCRDFRLRPLKVKDSLAVRRSPDAARCEKDDEMMGLALLGRRLKIESLDSEPLTLDFMLNLYDEDLAEIMAAEGRLEEKMARFRGGAAQTAHPGPAQAGAALGDGREPAGGGGDPVAGGLDGSQGPETGPAADLPGAPASP
jgi:phage FluMu protein gp41